MLSVIQEKSVQLLETIVERLEKYEQVQKRPRVFAKSEADTYDEGSHSSHESNTEEADKTEKLKQLSFELIDIGLYTSQLGIDAV